VDRILGGEEEGAHQSGLSMTEGIGSGGRRSASRSAAHRQRQNGRGGSTQRREARGGAAWVKGEQERSVHCGSMMVSRAVAGVVWEEEGKRRTLRLAVSTSYSRNRRCEPAAWRREPWAEAVVAPAAVWYGRGLSAVVQTVRLTGGPHAV
jgi:hypothetical protein